jgi:hypothetical protein
MAMIDTTLYSFGGTADALQGRDLVPQAVVTTKLNVNSEIGKQRRQRINEAGVSEARVLGSALVNEYDSKHNIYGGDPLLQEIGNEEFDTGPFFDGRAFVCSSLAGHVLGDDVRTDDDLYARFRFAGFAAYDFLVSNPHSQIRHGITGYVGGSIGGTTHRKTEPVYHGDLLQLELPPVNAEARARWEQELAYDERYQEGAMKPVLSVWNPFGAVDLLADSIGEFVANERIGQALFEHLDPAKMTASLGGSPLTRKDQLALLKIRAGMSWAYFGILAAERYGLVTVNNLSVAERQAKAQLTPKDLDARANYQGRRNLAIELGIFSRNGRSEPHVPLMSTIVATVCNEFLGSDAERALFDASTYCSDDPLVPGSDAYQLRRFQHDALIGEARAHADAYYSHAARIVARSIRHSHRNGPLDFTIAR